jgi:hypothetical protein
MKIKFRFIERTFEPDYYHKNIDRDIMVQKKGWFGWTNLVYIYDGNWSGHLHWSYFLKPSRCDSDASFKTKKEAMLFLRTLYNKTKIKHKVL